jgi:hypothetical protein
LSAGATLAASLPASYPSLPARSRATLLSLVAGIHVIAIVAILSIRALVVTIEKPPLRLEILPEPPRPASIVATLPAPQLRKSTFRTRRGSR